MALFKFLRHAFMWFLLLGLPLLAIATYPNRVDHSKVPFPEGRELSKHSVSGFIPISHSSDTFYWLFLSNENAFMKPTIVWVQDQIGVSSLFGLFNEFTPAWLVDFNVLFVDATVGTGFSFTSSEPQLASENFASQVFHFLNLFFDRHEGDISNELIIAGEDYAGHTIPPKFKLIGTSVGNGQAHSCSNPGHH
jgi:carboxypeptidase C (cathepsin A)